MFPEVRYYHVNLSTINHSQFAHLRYCDYVESRRWETTKRLFLFKFFLGENVVWTPHLFQWTRGTINFFFFLVINNLHEI